MSDDAKDRLVKIAKLVGALRELQAKQYEVTEEIDRLLNGAAGIGTLLKRVEHTFEDAWATRYHGKYAWAFVKDVPQLKRLLKLLGAEEVERRIGRYIGSEDQFFVRARHSFGIFVHSVNQFADETGAPADLDLDAPVVADCHHDPMCRSDQEHTRRKMQDVRGSTWGGHGI